MGLEGVIIDFLIAFVVSMGWAIMFRVRVRFVWLGGLLGGIGHAIRFLLMQQFDIGIVFATFVGCLFIGLISVIISYYSRKPSVIFTIPASITMIPGLFAYRTMIGGIKLTEMKCLDDNPVIIFEIMHNLTITISLLFALAFGISLGAILSRKVLRK